ncbi:MAG: alpha/beta hydrolase family esterase [Bdellovibrionota bacterium]
MQPHRLFIPFFLFMAAALARAETNLERHAIQFGGRERAYLIETNVGVKPTGLIFAFHGGGDHPEAFRQKILDLRGLALEKNFALIFPQGESLNWEDGRTEREMGHDDIGFTRKLVSVLTREFHIGKRETFAVGFSNGAGFVYRIACEIPESFGAGAAVAMNMPVALTTNCTPKTSLPLLIITSNHDPVIPFGGGTVVNWGKPQGNVLSAEETEKFWKERNKSEAAVVRLVNQSNRHEWPGLPQPIFSLEFFKQLIFGKDPPEINATSQVMAFFLARGDK